MASPCGAGLCRRGRTNPPRRIPTSPRQGDSMSAPRPRALAFALAPVALVVALLAGCGSGSSSAGSGGRLNVVAAEDFWGSLAEQLGGDRVQVTNIITNPAADPHDYEPTSE